MTTNDMLSAINEEIQTLVEVRRLLSGSDVAKKRGPNPGSATAFIFGVNKPRKKRVMSAEARERIAAAQRKRWAKQKAAAKK
jgi:hypothetical protein